ncbi:nuclear transport factor 2 family protein [Sphingomonas sp. KR3-1]|uniref:YybH family protein n=1 Tax=Sphingomonas sp. KR3-1 TaxID=3156611 RepID=UPI0032B4D55C
MTDTPDAIFTRYEDAIRRRDADAIVADYLPDAIGYDLAPPLVHRAPAMLDPEGIRQWFETWEADLRVTHRDAQVLEQGDLAVVHALQHMTGTRKGEGPSSLWFRATIAARRVEGAWKIAHIHTSVPFAMDGSGKALLDLEPED